MKTPYSLLRLALPLPAIACLAAAPPMMAQAPANDNFADRQPFPAGTQFSLDGSTVGASQESFEVINAGDSLIGESINESNTVWYSWTPAVSGRVRVNFMRKTNQGDTYLLVFQGTTPDLAHLVAQGYTSEGPGFSVTAGQEYALSLGNTRFPTDFTLKVTLTPTSSASAPVATVSVSEPLAVRATGQKGKLLLQLSAPASAALTIAYKTAGKAVSGTDYKPLKGVVTIPADKSSAVVNVKPLAGEGADKANVKITIQPGVGYTVGDPAAGRVKIVAGE